MKRSGILILAAGLLATAPARAEFRVWSSKDGASNVEAQFIQVSGSKIVLEKTDGTRVMVPQKMLCEKDQEYLAAIIPPEMKIDVDVDKDSNKISEGYSYTQKEDSFAFKVLIKKKSSSPCTQKFKAYFYVMASEAQGSRRKVIASRETSFDFMNTDSTSMNADAKVTNSDYYYGGKEGMEYEGYLVVVENEQGEVILMDSTKSTYEKNLDLIRKNKGGAMFSL